MATQEYMEPDRRKPSEPKGGEVVQNTEKELSEIKEKLAAIESLLQRLPEIQAAVFFQMLDEYQVAKLSGRKAQDLWEVPNSRAR